jgi:hypothetical protein
MAALENAALNGDLFRPHRSPSPARSLSPDQTNTDDELGSDLSRPPSPPHTEPSSFSGPSDGGPQTGVKGVKNDRDTHRRATRLARDLEKRAIIADQEKHAIVGATSTEEDELRDQERATQESQEYAWAREKWRASRKAEILRGAEETSGGRSSGLREVSKSGFLHAVENPGWTVILIYETVRRRKLAKSKLIVAEHPSLSLDYGFSAVAFALITLA